MIKKEWQQQETPLFSEVAEGFTAPPPYYYPFAFWFWSGPLSVDEAARQAREMCNGKLSPGYLQERGLNQPQYLTDQWFDAVEAALKETEEAGMCMGYCDEIGAPCGIIGGRLPGERPELNAVSLKWEIVDMDGMALFQIPDCFFAVAAKKTENTPDGDFIYSSSLRILEKEDGEWQIPEGKWRIYCFYKYQDKSAAGSFVNYLDKRLAETVIEMVHAKYEVRFKDSMGSGLCGVFMDAEGDYGYKLAWSDDLDTAYRESKQRDLRLWMPMLIDEDAEGLWVKARWDWFDVVSDIYSSNFFGKINQWYAERDMFTTCHTWEENLLGQALQAGDCFKVQRSLSMPGIDCLCYDYTSPRLFKETHSVSQFEGRRFMCELLGCSGWGLTPDNMRAAVNASVAWGVNHFVLHGIDLNRRFKDVGFAPDFFEWNPYWRYFREYSEYISRASYINSMGYTAADVLLYNPMDSIWALTGDGAFDERIPFHDYIIELHHMKDLRYGERIAEIEKSYSGAMEALSQARIEYLITDNYYLRQMQLADGRFMRGRHAFKAVVLPDVFLIPCDILRMLIDFAGQGGHLYFLGKLPCASAEKGLQDNELKSLVEKMKKMPTVHELSGCLTEYLKSDLPGLESHTRFVTGEFLMLQQHRIIDKKHFFWLVNTTGIRQEFELDFIELCGQASIWDCRTGEQRLAASEAQKGNSRTGLTMEPYEAYWLIIDPDRDIFTEKPSLPARCRVMALDDLWKVSVPASEQPVPTEIQPEIPEKFKDPEGIQLKLESWTSWGLAYFTGFVDYEKEFILEGEQQKVYLDLEDVRYMAEVWVNGRSVGSSMWKPFRFDISSFVKPSQNTLKIRVGNTLINAAQPYEREWHYKPSDADFFDSDLGVSGLLGTVKISFVPLEYPGEEE